MVTLAILFTVLVILALIAIISLIAGGVSFIITFGDVIVAIFVIYKIAQHFSKKKKEEE